MKCPADADQRVVGARIQWIDRRAVVGPHHVEVEAAIARQVQIHIVPLQSARERIDVFIGDLIQTPKYLYATLAP